jgi:hypothetical protein
MSIEPGQVWTAKGYGSDVTVTKAGEKTVTFVNREGTSQRLSVTGFRQLFVPKEVKPATEAKAEEASPVKAEALPMIEVEISPSTQYATVYCDGKPVGTVQRRRVLDKASPVWRAYNLKGEELFSTNYGAREIVRGFAKILLPPRAVNAAVKEACNRPMAARGLTSYRYKTGFSYIMIGAENEAQALKEAARSLSCGVASPAHLEIWNGEKYVPVI